MTMTMLWVCALVFLAALFFAVKSIIVERASMNGKAMQESREKGLQQIKAIKNGTYKETEYKMVSRPCISVYSASRKVLIDKYGEPTKTISLKASDLKQEIIAFEASKRIWICGKDFSMSDILGCSLEDNHKVIKGEITSTTQTKNGNMVKRAVVGNILLGGAGAVIGGSTAGKTTITTQGDDTVQHDYTIVINVDSLSNPILRIHVGRDGVLANEIVGLMNVIVNRNKKTPVE